MDVARRIYWRFEKWWRLRHLIVPKDRKDYLEMQATFSDDSLIVGGWEVMQDWEKPLMRTLAEQVTRRKGHILEVGFGMGISASYIMELGCSEYTVIEPHPAVLQKARQWALQQAVPVHILEGFWEDVIDRSGVFDGILFDTYPTSRKEFKKLVHGFIPKASEHLKPGGIFTYFSGASETLQPDHLGLLMKHFEEVRLFKETGLKPPPNSQYFSASQMLVPVCTK